MCVPKVMGIFKNLDIKRYKKVEINYGPIHGRIGVMKGATLKSIKNIFIIFFVMKQIFTSTSYMYCPIVIFIL